MLFLIQSHLHSARVRTADPPMAANAWRLVRVIRFSLSEYLDFRDYPA
jgi:hypothetical protein